MPSQEQFDEEREVQAAREIMILSRAAATGNDHPDTLTESNGLPEGGWSADLDEQGGHIWKPWDQWTHADFILNLRIEMARYVARTDAAMRGAVTPQEKLAVDEREGERMHALAKWGWRHFKAGPSVSEFANWLIAAMLAKPEYEDERAAAGVAADA